MNIETISNGWIVTNKHGAKQSFTDIEDLLKHMLLALDGKSENFGGSMYGKVTVSYKEPKSVG